MRNKIGFKTIWKQTNKEIKTGPILVGIKISYWLANSEGFNHKINWTPALPLKDNRRFNLTLFKSQTSEPGSSSLQHSQPQVTQSFVIRSGEILAQLGSKFL